MKLNRLSLFCCCLFMLFCLSGCKKQTNPDGRLDVSGTLTLNGGPFVNANATEIIFEPIDDITAGISSAPFDATTGKFLCTKQDGLKPGKYRVKILAQALYDKRTKKPVGPDFGTGQDDASQDDGKGYFVTLIPPEFNEKSTIEFEADASKKNVFDYDVKTDYQPKP